MEHEQSDLICFEHDQSDLIKSQLVVYTSTVCSYLCDVNGCRKDLVNSQHDEVPRRFEVLFIFEFRGIDEYPQLVSKASRAYEMLRACLNLLRILYM